jgi:hypothetical protein
MLDLFGMYITALGYASLIFLICKLIHTLYKIILDKKDSRQSLINTVAELEEWRIDNQDRFVVVRVKGTHPRVEEVLYLSNDREFEWSWRHHLDDSRNLFLTKGEALALREIMESKDNTANTAEGYIYRIKFMSKHKGMIYWTNR